MATKTQVMTTLLNDLGNIVGNTHITYSLTNIPTELDIVTTPPGINTALRWHDELQKWIPGTLLGMDVSAYLHQSEVDARIKNVMGAAPSQVDSLGEITAVFGQDTTTLNTIYGYRDHTIKVYTGNGVQSLFDIEHTAGRISVSVNGIEKIYKITDYSDTAGTLNMTTGFDFWSVDNAQAEVYSQGSAAKIEFTTTSIPANGDNIEIRIY